MYNSESLISNRYPGGSHDDPWVNLAAKTQIDRIEQCKKYMFLISDNLQNGDEIPLSWIGEVISCKKWFHGKDCEKFASVTNYDGPYIWEQLNKLYNKENFDYESEAKKRKSK